MPLPKDPWIRTPVSQIICARQGGFHCIYRDRWWAIDKDENVLFYKTTASPQCNTNRRIMEHMRLGKDDGAHVV